MTDIRKKIEERIEGCEILRALFRDIKKERCLNKRTLFKIECIEAVIDLNGLEVELKKLLEDG